tara:strand:+ start:1292 stop:2740 length:1449 start_codon:yes stop_codon:yes gene_type:complete
MQGFINTTAGLRPLLLEGIEKVTYSTIVTSNSESGVLSIQYIPNTGIGGGNVYVYIPHFTNGNYALERFWDWVGSVSAGAVGKTLNSFYNNKPFTGIRTVSFDASFSQSDAYVVKVADNASIADTCAVLFQAQSVTGTENTFLNVVTNAATNADPTIGAKVYLSSSQGFNNFEGNFNSVPSPVNPALSDGTYAWLVGDPETFEKGSNFPQVGTVSRVEIKSGFVIASAICPIDFSAANAVSDIQGYIYVNYSPAGPGATVNSNVCFDLYSPFGSETGSANIPSTSTSNRWIPVTLGLIIGSSVLPATSIPPNFAPPTAGNPQYGDFSQTWFQCNYYSGNSGDGIPPNTLVYMKDTVSGEYRLLESGNTWTLPQVPVPQTYDPPIPAGDPRLYQYDNFYGQPNKIMAIPSQQTLQQDAAADPYSFQINWSDVWSGFIKQNNDPLVCDYFKSKLAGGTTLFGTSMFAVGSSGRITSISDTCDFS